MVDIKDSLPELNDPGFNRDLFMSEFDQPKDALKFLIEVMTKRHYFEDDTKQIQLQDIILGVKKDDGFEKVIKFIYDYLVNNNPNRSERERLLYMYVLSDEIKIGITEYEEAD